MPASTVIAALGVERQHAIERACIDEHAGLAELLTAHRVPSTRDGHRYPLDTWRALLPPPAR